jgi:hypothetical protein
VNHVIFQYRQSGYFRAPGEWLDLREPIYALMYRRLRLAEIYVQ